MNNTEELFKDDAGIDPDNYNLEEEIARYKNYKPTNFQLLIRVYKPKTVKQTASGIYLPESLSDRMSENAQFTNQIGLVIKMCDGCYKGEKYKITGDFCKVGDWVIFMRAAGHTALGYNKHNDTTLFIWEDSVVCVIDDPRDFRQIRAGQ